MSLLRRGQRNAKLGDTLRSPVWRPGKGGEDSCTEKRVIPVLGPFSRDLRLLW